MDRVVPKPPATAASKAIRPATSRETWEKLVNAFRVHEGRPDRFAVVGKLCGVHRDTAEKAYKQGLGKEWSNTPIKDLLIAERAQKAAVSTVILAAKTVPSPGTQDPDQAALAAALGQTAFEQLQASVRAAVMEEIDLVDGARRCAARALRASERLAEFIEARVDAILKKFGPQVAEDGTITPMVLGTIADEAKLLEVLGRTGHKSATLARLAIEMERLRIGDPDALRRRLDSVYGGELGGTGKGAPAGDEEPGTEVEDETAASPEEVGDVDDWLGFKVLQGGKSPRAAAPARAVSRPPAAPAADNDAVEEEEPASGDGPV